MAEGRIRGINYVIGLLVVGLILTSATLVAGARPAAAVDCACTGDFVAPTAEPPKTVSAANVAQSPKGTGYTLTVEGGTGGGTLVLTKAGSTPLRIPVGTETSGWGFAPDGQRFLTYGRESALYDLATRRELFRLTNSSNVRFSPDGTWALARWVEGADVRGRLYAAATGQVRNLGGSDTIPHPDVIGFAPDSRSLLVAANNESRLYRLSDGVRVLERSGAPSSSVFSPDGRYLEVATVVGSTVELRVVESATGAQAFSSTFPASAPPVVSTGWDKANPQASGGFGFSQDGGTFVVASGSTSSATVRVVDLDARRTVISKSYTGSAGWALSPCGEVFASVTGSSSSMVVELYSTSSGERLANRSFPAGTLELKADDDSYLAVVASGPVALSPNLSCAQVSFTLPSEIAGGSTVEQQLTLSRPAPAGGLDIELSSSSAALTVPARVTVPGGRSTVTVTMTSASVAVGTEVTVTATTTLLGQRTTVSSTTTVSAAALASVTLADEEIYAGESTTATVTVSSAAPAGGTPVTLSVDDESVDVPESVTVPAGQTSVETELGTAESPDDIDVTLIATLRGTSKSAALRVIGRVATTTTATVERLAVPVGGEVLITAEVSAADPDTAPWEAPAGTVEVLRGSEVLATAELEEQDGTEPPTSSADLAVSGLAAGRHDLVVRYGGSGPLAASQTTVEAVVVEGAVWTGGGDGTRWSDPENWSGGVPGAGEQVFVDVDDRASLLVDVPGLTVGGLQLWGPVELDGEAVTLTGDLEMAGSRLALDLDLPEGEHVVRGGTAHISGVLSGPGRLTFANGTMHLAGANTYTGTTTIARRATVVLEHDAGLGATGSGTTLSGRLCAERTVTSTEPLTSLGGTLGGCVEPEPEDSWTDEEWDAYQAATATFAGAVDNAQGLKLQCLPLHDDTVPRRVAVDGPISGAGSVTVCAEATYGGTKANTYTGGTTVRADVIDDWWLRGTLRLAKPDGVVALPGDATGDRVLLAADGQIAPDADLDLHTLDIGTAQASVGSLRLSHDAVSEWQTRGEETGLIVGVEGESHGSLSVAGTVDLENGMYATALADAEVGAVLRVVSAGGAVTGCLDRTTLSGSERVDYKVVCSARAIDLRGVWHSVLEISSDPQVVGNEFTVSVRVLRPEGAPAADGEVGLAPVGYEWGKFVVGETTSLTDLRDGVATITLPRIDDGSYRLTGVYQGGSSYGDAYSELIDLWALKSGQRPPDRRGTPTVWFDLAGDGQVQIRWSRNAQEWPTVEAHQIRVRGSDGSERIIGTNISFARYGWRTGGAAVTDWQWFGRWPYYTVEGLTPGVVYTFAVRAAHGGGFSAWSGELVWSEGRRFSPVHAAPTGLAATADGSVVELSWTAPEGALADPERYVIAAVDAEGNTHVRVSEGSSTSTTISDLPAGTYTFTVRAEGEGGLGAASEPTPEVAVTAGEPTPTSTSTTEPTSTSTTTPTPTSTTEPTSTSTTEPTPTSTSTEPPRTTGPPTTRPTPPNRPTDLPTPSDRPSGPPSDRPTPAPKGTADSPTVTAGGDVRVSAEGFEPGETVRIELHSTPVVLGAVRADTDGRVHAQITIPDATRPGRHTVWLIGTDSGHRVQVPLTVAAGAAGPRREGGAPTSAVVSANPAVPHRVDTGAVTLRHGATSAIAIVLGAMMGLVLLSLRRQRRH